MWEVERFERAKIVGRRSGLGRGVVHARGALHARGQCYVFGA